MPERRRDRASEGIPISQPPDRAAGALPAHQGCQSGSGRSRLWRGVCQGNRSPARGLKVRSHAGHCYRTAGGMMSETGGTHHTDSARVPGPEIQRLGALVGRWRSEGHIVGEVPVPITGTDIYQWLPGGFFLVHHVDVVIGEQTVQAIELIGEYDPQTTPSPPAPTTTRATSRSCVPGLTSTACGRSPVAATSPWWPGPPPLARAEPCGPH